MARQGTVQTKYLIIGNSAGGIGAVEAIREVDRTGSITIVSDEPYPAYSRPLISKYLAGERTLDGMLFRTPDFYQRNSVTTLLGVRVATLLVEDRTAELDNGRRIVWEKLLIAAGGAPIVPPIEGKHKQGVFSFNTLADARAIDGSLEQVEKAVVIGGGLIGVSVTEALVKRGVSVSVVERESRILNTILDERASRIAEDALRKAGVTIIDGSTAAEVLGRETVTGVVLDSNAMLPCGLVVVAVGVSPRLDLVEGTGIKVNRGILVDRTMATTCPDVYACGDVAEAHDVVYGTNRVTPTWPNAYMSGRTAGRNMAGVETHYPGGISMNSLSYFGLDITAAGLTVPPEGNGYRVLSRHGDSQYRSVVLRDGCVVGMICVGDIERSGILCSLIREAMPLQGLDEELLADDFGLVSLPRALWEGQLTALTGKSVAEETERHHPEEYVSGE